jgi:hypothetical protein
MLAVITINDLAHQRSRMTLQNKHWQKRESEI